MKYQFAAIDSESGQGFYLLKTIRNWFVFVQLIPFLETIRARQEPLTVPDVIKVPDGIYEPTNILTLATTWCLCTLH